MDVEHAEKVEAELDAFVERRAREARDAATVEELWASSARLHRQKRRQQNGWAWYRFYSNLAGLHRGLANENEEKAARVLALVEDSGAMPEEEAS